MKHTCSDWHLNTKYWTSRPHLFSPYRRAKSAFFFFFSSGVLIVTFKTGSWHISRKPQMQRSWPVLTGAATQWIPVLWYLGFPYSTCKDHKCCCFCFCIFIPAGGSIVRNCASSPEKRRRKAFPCVRFFFLSLRFIYKTNRAQKHIYDNSGDEKTSWINGNERLLVDWNRNGVGVSGRAVFTPLKECGYT